MFSNAIKLAVGAANAIAEVGYGVSICTSSDSETLECTSEGLASGFNGGTPIRALGQSPLVLRRGTRPQRSGQRTN